MRLYLTIIRRYMVSCDTLQFELRRGEIDLHLYFLPSQKLLSGVRGAGGWVETAFRRDAGARDFVSGNVSKGEKEGRGTAIAKKSAPFSVLRPTVDS